MDMTLAPETAPADVGSAPPPITALHHGDRPRAQRGVVPRGPRHGADHGGALSRWADRRAGPPGQRTVDIGLDEHEANEGERFAPHRTGLDHVALAVPSRAELDTWQAHLTACGVECSAVRDVTEPMPFALLTFTDPDGVAFELIHMPAPA